MNHNTPTLEDRYRRVSRGMSIALVAISFAMLASATVAVANERDWLDSGSPLIGLLTFVTVAGYLAFGVLMLLGWRFSRGLDPEQRAQLSDELERFTNARSVKRAFIVTMVAAALLAALPESLSWPGRAAAATLFAVGMLSLAWDRLRADA